MCSTAMFSAVRQTPMARRIGKINSTTVFHVEPRLHRFRKALRTKLSSVRQLPAELSWIRFGFPEALTSLPRQSFVRAITACSLIENVPREHREITPVPLALFVTSLPSPPLLSNRIGIGQGCGEHHRRNHFDLLISSHAIRPIYLRTSHMCLALCR